MNTSFHLKDALSVVRPCQANIQGNLLISAYKKN